MEWRQFELSYSVIIEEERTALKMAERKTVTLRDVAKRAGVSTATVSRVLNASEYVSPEIQDKVRQTIQELGYYQNTVTTTYGDINGNGTIEGLKTE